MMYFTEAVMHTNKALYVIEKSSVFFFPSAPGVIKQTYYSIWLQ